MTLGHKILCLNLVKSWHVPGQPIRWPYHADEYLYSRSIVLISSQNVKQVVPKNTVCSAAQQKVTSDTSALGDTETPQVTHFG